MPCNGFYNRILDAAQLKLQQIGELASWSMFVSSSGIDLKCLDVKGMELRHCMFVSGYISWRVLIIKMNHAA